MSTIHSLWSNKETTYKLQMKTKTPLLFLSLHSDSDRNQHLKMIYYCTLKVLKNTLFSITNNILMKKVSSPRVILRR